MFRFSSLCSIKCWKITGSFNNSCASVVLNTYIAKRSIAASFFNPKKFTAKKQQSFINSHNKNHKIQFI